MAKIVKLRHHDSTRFGLKRVRKTKQKLAEDHGQLDLFSPGQPDAKIVQFSALSAFDNALKLDEAGSVPAAREAYLKAIKNGDRVADAYCNLGIIEAGMDHAIKAINCFTKAIQRTPRHFQAHYNLANLYSEQKNYELARFHYQVAIEITPDFPNAYYNLGLVLLMSKEYAEAIRILTLYKTIAHDEDLGNTNELIESLRRSLTD